LGLAPVVSIEPAPVEDPMLDELVELEAPVWWPFFLLLFLVAADGDEVVDFAEVSAP
jgi:hypothetical protein